MSSANLLGVHIQSLHSDHQLRYKTGPSPTLSPEEYRWWSPAGPNSIHHDILDPALSQFFMHDKYRTNRGAQGPYVGQTPPPRRARPPRASPRPAARGKAELRPLPRPRSRRPGAHHFGQLPVEAPLPLRRHDGAYEAESGPRRSHSGAPPCRAAPDSRAQPPPRPTGTTRSGELTESTTNAKLNDRSKFKFIRVKRPSARRPSPSSGWLTGGAAGLRAHRATQPDPQRTATPLAWRWPCRMASTGVDISLTRRSNPTETKPSWNSEVLQLFCI